MSHNRAQYPGDNPTPDRGELPPTLASQDGVDSAKVDEWVQLNRYPARVLFALLCEMQEQGTPVCGQDIRDRLRDLLDEEATTHIYSVLSNLEEENWIISTTDPDDGRKSLYTLTDKSRKLVTRKAVLYSNLSHNLTHERGEKNKI
jgi:DNA-binding PadR family transcriptional regulator